jgi:hypothetical protein
MAIFPLHNSHIANYDVLRSDTFKSGMVLMRDSNGYAVKADRTSLATDSLSEQMGKFLGFASNDHDVNNSIILPDPIGSNYVDSGNNFIQNVNSHYGVFKRSIAEFSDENVSRYYNIFDNSLLTRRGVGVYNLESETYITDQFNPVIAYTLYLDDTATTTLSPGDLLTFGAGINAGKLVKVDTSGFGPSVLVVGVVDKFDSGTNLLYFTHSFDYYRNVPNLFTTGITLNLDASNPTSYSGSGATWYDLSGNNLNGALVNGVSFTNNYFSFDGANDYVEVLDNDLLDFPNDFTVETVYRNDGGFNLGIVSKFRGGVAVGTWALACFYGEYGVKDFFWDKVGSGGNSLSSSPKELIIRNRWNHLAVTRISGIKYIYIDGVLASSGADSYDYSGFYHLCFGRWGGSGFSSTPTSPTGVFSNASMMATRIFKGVGLSSDQIRQNFHAQIGKLI